MWYAREREQPARHHSHECSTYEWTLCDMSDKWMENAMTIDAYTLKYIFWLPFGGVLQWIWTLPCLCDAGCSVQSSIVHDTLARVIVCRMWYLEIFGHSNWNAVSLSAQPTLLLCLSFIHSLCTQADAPPFAETLCTSHSYSCGISWDSIRNKI